MMHVPVLDSPPVELDLTPQASISNIWANDVEGNQHPVENGTLALAVGAMALLEHILHFS